MKTTEYCSGELDAFHVTAIRFLCDVMSINHSKESFLKYALTE